METTTLDAWVAGYTRAWESNDPADIAALFTEDAASYTAPHRQPWRGQDGIVAGWLDRKDEPGDWTVRHEILAVAGDLGFVRGWTTYADPPQTYGNLWVVRLTPDGRASGFTEWWMVESQEA